MKLIRKQSGFSLIELMIAVAIIGILAAVAIPNYTRFQNKARQSEARTNLEGIFTSNKAFFAEFVEYTARFDAMGFRPEGTMAYNTGFNADLGAPVNPACTTDGTATCINTGATAMPGCIAAYGTSWLPNGNSSNVAIPGTAVVTAPPGATFLAIAIGNISGNGDDTWQIDQNKALVNSTPQLD